MSIRTLVLAGLLMVLTLQASVRAEDAVATLNDDLYIGKPIAIDNITVWPVYSKKESPSLGEFMDLKDAESKKLAVVREIGTAAAAVPNQAPAQLQHRGGDNAQVNEVVIDNKSDKPILVLAGTLIKGGKQDRQIGEDFIIQPGKTVSVNAFCVEHGRWTAQREGQTTNGVFTVQDSLSSINVRSAAQKSKNQGEVWENVAKENAKAGNAPATGTYQSIVDETDKGALEKRNKLLRHLEEGLATLQKNGEKPLGLAYAIDGKVREVRSFVQPEVFQHYQKTLLNTIAIEGDIGQRAAVANKKEIYKDIVAAESVPELIKKIDLNKAERTQTKTGSVIMQKRGAKVIGNGTYMEGNEKVPVTSNWSESE